MPPPSPQETVRLLFEARAAGDLPRLAAMLHPDFEATTLRDGRTYTGIEAVRDYFAAEAAGPRTEVCAHRVVVEDGAVLVFGRIRVLDRGSVSDSPAAWRFVVEDGRIRSVVPLRGALAPAAAVSHAA